MPKKRSSTRKKKNTKAKRQPAWGHWILALLLSVGVYAGVHFLMSKDFRVSIKKSVSKSSAQSSAPAESESPWGPHHLAKFLPKDAVENEYEAFPFADQKSALFIYAKKIPGKQPGPHGVLNTTPGLRYIQLKGTAPQIQDIKFASLEAALGGVNTQDFMGPPQLEDLSKKFDEDSLWGVRIMLTESDREVMAYLWMSDSGPRWAPLHHASGKKMPAAFVIGATEKYTRELKVKSHDGKTYLIVRNGILDELKPYEGYRWKAQAYVWEEGRFEYDQRYSRELNQR